MQIDVATTPVVDVYHTLVGVVTLVVLLADVLIGQDGLARAVRLAKF